MSPDQQSYVITKPGGLSGTAHAVHILICLLTCGLWIPGYLLFMIFAPARRQEVITPYGAPVPHIQGIPRPLPTHLQQTPEQTRANKRLNTLVTLAILGSIAVAIGVGVIVSALTR